jgi:hypothetical protein
LSRPIIVRLRSESHQSNGITVRQNHQTVLQQNRALSGHKSDIGCPLCADIVAKVAEASLWNSNLKQSNRGVRTFESMLRVRVKI